MVKKRDRIVTRLFVSYLITFLLIVAIAVYTIIVIGTYLKTIVGNGTKLFTEEILKRINYQISSTLEIIQAHLVHSILQDTLKDSNKAFSRLPDPEAYMNEIEKLWKPFLDYDEDSPVQKISNTPLSITLRKGGWFSHKAFSVSPGHDRGAVL